MQVLLSSANGIYLKTDYYFSFNEERIEMNCTDKEMIRGAGPGFG